MISTRQQAYLDAMDIGVWHLRESPSAATSVENDPESLVHTAPALKLGPGRGGVLLVCATDTDSASRLANDISRALGSVPVWAWPNADTSAVKLPDAIEENLFTTVAVFGNDLALQLFGGELPSSLNSAKLVLLPSIQDIQSSAEACRGLWNTFCRSGMVSTDSG